MLETARAIAGNFGLLVDPKVGIVSRVEALPPLQGSPDLVHLEAETCDPAALGGVSDRFRTVAAGVDRSTAAPRALSDAIAHYCAALYDRNGLPLARHGEATFARTIPTDFALYSPAQYAEPGFPFVRFDAATPVRWTSAIDLATGESVHVPAAFIWTPYSYRRGAGDLPIAPPDSAGLVCRRGVAAAALAGLSDVIARDAAAIFWLASVTPPKIRKETLPENLRALVRRIEATGDRVTILDVTTNNRVPGFIVAMSSEEPERPAFVFAAAAGLDLVATIGEALLRLAEVARLSAAVMHKRPPPASTNDWEEVVDPEDHLQFAVDHRNRDLFAFAFSSDEERNLGDYESLAAGSVDADLETAVRGIIATGYRAYAANLTSDDIAALGLNVCRAIVPGYQPIFSGHHVRALGGERPYEVPQKLGYRGILRGRANPAPHPFI